MNKQEIPLWLRLGASMDVPSTHPELTLIASGQKHPTLRSVIFCTEDAILEKDVPEGLKNIEGALSSEDVKKGSAPFRPRTKFGRVA
jgi:citrate lyase beta subunit